MPIPKNYVAQMPQSAKDRAFSQIQEWIIDGTLQPGEKLFDKELATAIGLSRTPVREALQILALQGFITMKPGVATYVNPAEPSDLAMLLKPSAALQAVAAETAAPRTTEEFIDKLKTLNEKLEESLAEKDFFASLKYDEQFHLAIIRLADNPFLESPLINLMAHVRRQFFMKSISLSINSVNEHARLIKALEDSDAEKSATIAKEHWTRSVNDFLKNI